MHYTFEQLTAHVKNPEPAIEEHLEKCSACYETTLLIRLAASYDAETFRSEPSAAFLRELNAKLPVKPGRLAVLKKPVYWAPLLAAASLLLSLNLFFFRPGAEMTLTYAEGEVFINNKPAVTGQKIHIQDEVKTGEDALALVRFGQHADMAVLPTTSVTLVAIGRSDLPEIRVLQKSGYTFNRIAKGKVRYIISTEKFDAVVRGTQFAVDLNHAEGRIKLSEGQLSLRYGDAQANLVAGYSLSAEQGKFSRMEKLKPGEVSYAAIFASIPFAAPEILKGAGLQQDKVDVLLRGEDGPWQLDDIRRKYRKLSVIYTRNGQKFIGGFYSNDQTITVQTEKAKVKLSVRDVEKIIPYERL